MYLNLLQHLFEKILWNSRLFVLFAVVMSMIGAILLFVVASYDVILASINTYKYYRGALEQDADIHNVLLHTIVSAIDLYLIAVVLLIFSFGLYELFIRKINIKDDASSKVLEIHTLDQLKDKLAKVIVMALIVAFFSKVLNMGISESKDMILFASSILAICIGLYF